MFLQITLRLQEIGKIVFHTWQAGHEGTHVAFLPKMMNHTWQAMHRGTRNAKSAISLSGNIPNPLTISEKLAMLLR